MNTRSSLLSIAVIAGASVVLSGCAHIKVTHVPPHESLDVALAKRPELVRLPEAQQPVVTSGSAGSVGPAVEPELPGYNLVEQVAEAFSRGEFCMSAGKDDEAIVAFEEAVKIDPAFTEGWHHLAMLYEKKGNSKKAMEAFRRAKKFAQQ